MRRIVCLLDGTVVPFDLRDGADDGHGLVSTNTTEGHRFLSPGAFAVASCDDWAAKLRQRHVLVDADERRRTIMEGISALAGSRRLQLVEDPGLLDEVAEVLEGAEFGVDGGIVGGGVVAAQGTLAFLDGYRGNGHDPKGFDPHIL